MMMQSCKVHCRNCHAMLNVKEPQYLLPILYLLNHPPSAVNAIDFYHRKPGTNEFPSIRPGCCCRALDNRYFHRLGHRRRGRQPRMTKCLLELISDTPPCRHTFFPCPAKRAGKVPRKSKHFTPTRKRERERGRENQHTTDHTLPFGGCLQFCARVNRAQRA